MNVTIWNSAISKFTDPVVVGSSQTHTQKTQGSPENLVPQRYSEGLQREFNKADSSWEARQAVEEGPVITVM